MRITINLSNFHILSTGADGGHNYITANIQHKGTTRKIVVFFEDKSDERKLQQFQSITVEGTMMDEGELHSLNLLNSKLISGK